MLDEDLPRSSLVRSKEVQDILESSSPIFHDHYDVSVNLVWEISSTRDKFRDNSAMQPTKPSQLVSEEELGSVRCEKL